jgi:hypothetical protein
MARLRDSWHLSLSATPILRNPKRLFQPETVSLRNMLFVTMLIGAVILLIAIAYS